MRLRCPVCHAEAALEAWAEDDAAREMMALLSGLDATLGRALVAYLGLFRSASRALAWDRAVRLAREVLALDADPQRLAAALAQTVEQLRVKRDAGDIRPLTGHNYLKRVLEGVPAGAAAVVERAQDAPRLREAFRRLAAHSTRWPAPAELWQHLPARPEPPKLTPPPMSDAERERALRMVADLREKMRMRT